MTNSGFCGNFRLAAGALLILMGAMAPAAGAQSSGDGAAEGSAIPPDLLAVDRKRCMETCTPGGVEKEMCAALCDCTVDQFRNRFSFDRYLTVRTELAEGAVTEQTRQALDSIASYCTEQLPEPEADSAPDAGSGDKSTESGGN
ncbi:hypothetical protein [Yunchengibacter salinarum]|uniref:hypothetical protein n=1 Tax=Yunchengibacter salinarum TaxID=3133399 RepID=UPI0035B68AFC